MLSSLNIVGKSFEELMALFFCDISGDDDFYDVLAYSLAQANSKLLVAMLDGLSPKRLRAALFGLGIVGESESSRHIFLYLSHEEPLVVAAAIDALRRIGSVNWSDVARNLQHPSPYVRGAVLRFARARLGSHSLEILREALNDPSPIVRQNSLDELEGLVTVDDLAWITSFLHDPSVEVQAAAASLIAVIKDG